MMSSTVKPRLIICMGVSGSGKSTLAQQIAVRMGWRMIEADDYHSAENRTYMSAGKALNDEQRGPWLDAIVEVLCAASEAGEHCVLAFSGLRSAHRATLRQLNFEVCFIHLQLEKNEIANRLNARENHFMSPQLLDSQFAALECTVLEKDVIPLPAQSSPRATALIALTLTTAFFGN